MLNAWAAGYAAARPDTTCAEMAASIAYLGEIAGTIPDERTAKIQQAESKPSTAIVLLDGEEQWEVDRPEIEEVQDGLPELHKALGTWLQNSRTGPAE